MWSRVSSRRAFVVFLVLALMMSVVVVVFRPVGDSGSQQGKSVKPRLVYVPKKLKPSKRTKVVVLASRAALRVVSSGRVLKKVRCKVYRSSGSLKVCRFKAPSVRQAGSVVRLRVRAVSGGSVRVFVKKYRYPVSKTFYQSPDSTGKDDEQVGSDGRPPMLGAVDSCSELSEYFSLNVPSSATVQEGLGDGRGYATAVVADDFVVPTLVRGTRVDVVVDRPGSYQYPSTVYPASSTPPPGVYETEYYMEYGTRVLSPLLLVGSTQESSSGVVDVILKDSDVGITDGHYILPNPITGVDLRNSYFNGDYMLRVSYTVFVSYESDGDSVGTCNEDFTIPLSVTSVKSDPVIAGPLNGPWPANRGLAYDGQRDILKYSGSRMYKTFADKNYMVDPDVSWSSGAVWDRIYAESVVFSDLNNTKVFVENDLGDLVPVAAGQPVPISSMLVFEPVSAGSDMLFSVQLRSASGVLSAPAPAAAVKI